MLKRTVLLEGGPWLLLIAAMASGSNNSPPLLTLVKTPGAKPPKLIGFPLEATAGLRVDAEGKESPIPRKTGSPEEFEDTGGAQSQGVDPSQSLRWRLAKAPRGPCYLYFLCRTGHQQGYEYVSPTMAYRLDVNGKPVDLETVAEMAAVRTYQSKDGWGHDMGWIRSKAMVHLKPGDAITIGCIEKYAFVTQGLLVDEEAHRLTQLVGRVAAFEERMGEAEVLLRKIAETFPTAAVQSVATGALARLAEQRTRWGDLRDAMDAAAAKAECGERIEPLPLIQRAESLVRAWEAMESDLCRQLRQPLQQLRPCLRARLSAGSEANSFAGRQADYFRSVGQTYLAAAEGSSAKGTGWAALRRFATYLWRADQFASKAEQALGNENAGLPTAEIAAATVGPCERGEILLNGEWEMTTQGTPEAPGKSGWFKIRVPHGPWGETIGLFMASDRKWPGSHWAWYRVHFPAPAAWTQGRLKLHFEAVFHLCEVYVNGRYCGRHIGGFDAFDVDITGVAKPGQPNQLLCFVHDTSLTALEPSPRTTESTGCSSGPNHYVISDLWGQRFGGIWQDVSLIHEPAVRADDVFVITSYRKKTITVRTQLANETGQPVTVRVAQDVLDGGRVVLSLPPRTFTIPAGRTGYLETGGRWPHPRLWGLGGPWGDPGNLYFLRTRVTTRHLSPLDTHYARFGFREFWIEGGQFFLNGKRLPLQGGGNWYLQESKAPHGNRWFGLFMYRSERGMNVNLQRWHRHGDVAREFFDLGDELGMLSEPEGPYWGVYGIPDLTGLTDWDDPVWTANVTEHYRRWARKHRNHPSIVLWSIENETFCSTQRPKEMVDRFIAFGRALNEEDPTRPVTFHGVENGGYCSKRSDLQIVNLHYPSDDKVKDWQKTWQGRPCINGEFQNYEAWFNMSSPDAAKAAQATADMCRYIAHWTSYYRQIGLSGAFNFLPYMVALFTTADRSLMGPWSDLLPDPATCPAIAEGWMKGAVSLRATVPIPWPSLSGPGIKCERLVTGSGNLSLINWFDPERPIMTPNRTYAAYARCWEKMPALNPERAPEVIVTVTQHGQPVAYAAVLARPLEGQATNLLGVMSDPNGTAWFVFKEAGRYEIRCGDAKTVFNAKRLRTDTKPGYEDVPRVNLEM